MYKPPIKVILATAVLSWIAIGLFNTGIFIFNPEAEDFLSEFLYALQWTFLYHSPWLIIVPFIFFWGRKFPLSKKITAKNFSAHLILALVIAFLSAVVHTYFISIRAGIDLGFRNIAGNFFFYSADRILIYFVILLGYYAIDYYWKQSEESLRALQLQETINRQNFNSFKNDIQPRFLLNTLKDIEDIISFRLVLAERLIADLAHMIRKMLLNSQKKVIHPKDDLQFLKAYAAILEVRLDKTICIRESIMTEKENPGQSSALISGIPAGNVTNSTIKNGDQNSRNQNTTDKDRQNIDTRRSLAVSLAVISIVETLLEQDKKIFREFDTISYELREQEDDLKITIKLKELSPPDFCENFAGWMQDQKNKLLNPFKKNLEKNTTVKFDYTENGTLLFLVNSMKISHEI